MDLDDDKFKLLKIEVGSFILVTEDKPVADFECVPNKEHTHVDCGGDVVFTFYKGEILKVVDITPKKLDSPYTHISRNVYGLMNVDGQILYLHGTAISMDDRLKVMPSKDLKTITTLFGDIL